MKNDIPNFDHLLKLAQENPEELERLRANLAKRTIDSAHEDSRKRLRGLQFRIDSKRKIAKSPMSACISISKMMHQSFDELCHLLNTAAPSNIYQNTNSSSKNTATIINFPKSH